MEVCMLTRSVLAHSIGGMERHIDLLVRELAKLGHSVTVITTALKNGQDGGGGGNADGGGGGSGSKKRSGNEERQGAGGGSRGQSAGRQEGVRYIFTEGTEPGAYSRSFWSASRKALSGLEPDIVHSQSIGAYGVLGDLRKRDLPMVATCHGTPLSDAATAFRTHGLRANPAHLMGIMSKTPHHLKVYGEAKRVIADTKPIADHLVKMKHAPASKIDVVLLGVDTDFFSPVAGSFQKESEGHELFSIARVVKDKGFHFLIAAMPALLKEHPGARLIVGGDGPYLPDLKALARKLGIEKAVRFTGRVPEQELPGLYRSCDLFALATTFVEGFGLVLAEAMACGKPAASARIGGVTDVIREGVTGRLFEPGDQKDITRTLLELLSDPAKLKTMGEAAREDTLARFSAAKTARDTAAVYEKALK